MMENYILMYCLVAVSILSVILCIRITNKNDKLLDENSKLKDDILSNTKYVEESKHIKTEFNKLHDEIKQMKSKVIEAENKAKESKSVADNAKDIVFNIKPGYKGLIPDWSLYWTSTKQNFSVNYEVEILEITDNKFKVKGYNFTSDDSRAMEPANRLSILRHVDEKWVNRSKVEIIIDDAMRRDLKLNEILKDGN